MLFSVSMHSSIFDPPSGLFYEENSWDRWEWTWLRFGGAAGPTSPAETLSQGAAAGDQAETFPSHPSGTLWWRPTLAMLLFETFF